jgi:hypothetical protein
MLARTGAATAEAWPFVSETVSDGVGVAGGV